MPMIISAKLSFGLHASTMETCCTRAQRQSGNVVRRMADELVQARNAARKAKNFKEADRIRKELEEKGILLKDTPEGTTWELKR